MLPEPLLPYRRPILFALHVLLIAVGYYAAFALRFDRPLPDQYSTLFASTLVLVVPIRLGALVLFRAHRGWWRHVGMQDLADLTKAVTLSSAVLLAALFVFGRLGGMPRTVLILDWLLALFLFGGVRAAVRATWETQRGWRGAERRGKPALVIGAGDAAERLLRQVWAGGTGLRVVGLVDDDPYKRGQRLHRVPVLGSTQDIPEVVRAYGAELLVIAIPSASREEMQKIVDRCVATGVEFKIVPPLQELLDGRARVSQLRKVEVEDLLGRDAVELDLNSVRRDLAGKVVLVTGGAGSIGSELARQIAGFGPHRLVLLERAESPLYFIDLELRRDYPEVDVVPIVADVTDQSRLKRVLAEYRPHYVYHAAAYKHVPLMETNVAEAVRNNVLGTLRLALASAESGVERFVLISTDKAVRPSSVMGASKRIAERIVLGLPPLRAAATDFRAVRFGNVLGSDGSVIPVFRKQLAHGGPITVTHPEVTRYFMTIPEAVQLVLQAGALPEAAGRISMLEMGQPVKIVTLAENLIRLSGLEPYTEMPIVFSGLRPGEKLYEELMSEVECTIPTTLEKIRVVQTDEVDGSAIERGLDRLAASLEVGDTHDLVCGMCDMVPECVSPLRDQWKSTLLERTGRLGASGKL